MASPRITYKGIDIDLVMGKNDLAQIPRQRRNQNESASGKIETINLFGRWDYEFDSYFARSVYYDLWAWWSWARQGKGFSFALDSDNVGKTTIYTAAAGQKVIPVRATGPFTAGDICLIRATDEDNEFEIVEIDSVSVGVSVTAVDNLIYGYTARALSSESITNGGFDADTTGWTAANNATLASVAGGKVGNCLQITCNGSDNPYAYQILSVTPGDFWAFDGYQKAGTEGTYTVIVYDITNSATIWTTGELEESAGDWSTQTAREIEIPAECISVAVQLLQIASGGAGTTMLFDSISFKKINADTLSHKDYFSKVITTETDFRPPLTGVKDNTLRYYKHTFRFTENL